MVIWRNVDMAVMEVPSAVDDHEWGLENEYSLVV